MVKGGTTTFSDMYFFPEGAADQVEALGIRAQLCCPILDFPTSWGSGPEEYLKKSEELFKRYQDHPLIDIALGPHAPYTVSDEPLANIMALAEQYGMAIQMHIHETQQEVDDAVTSQGKRPLQRLDELGLFDHRVPVQAVHMTALNKEEIDLLARKGVNVIHCPESNMKLASGFCPTHKLITAGVNVALGTDGAASNNDLDMIGEMRTAALIAKGYTGDASAVSARDAIAMATINAAKALGIEERTGSLEEGKQADIIALDFARLNTAPSFNLEADIVYNLSSQQVTHTWVAGELLLDCGRLTRIDEKQLIQQAKEWSDKIKINN
jgi:5-methylthioadenosine/S-adenosylhomocysteine deaminase